MKAKGQIWPDEIKGTHFQLPLCNARSQQLASLLHFDGTELE